MNCKPGDLAICIRVLDPCLAENIGRIVTVVSASDYREEDSGPYWNIEAHAPGLLGWNGYEFVRGTECVIRDSSLRPVSGLPVDEEITEEVTA